MGVISAFIQYKKKYNDGSTLYDMRFHDDEHMEAPITVRMTAFMGDLVLVERLAPVPETVKTPVVGKEIA